MTSQRKINFVVFRYSHHSPHSGYSRLAEYGEKYFNGEIIRVAKPLSKFVIRERILWLLSKGTPGYDRSSMAAELNVAWQILAKKNAIFHFLYGETTYRYTSFFNNINQNRLVATFHLPPDEIPKAVQVDAHIQKLSAVICVGSNQQDFFSRIMDNGRIFFAPLGIDTQYYTPPENIETRDANLCLVVGENYRDYPTLRGVIELVSYRRPATKFLIVANKRSEELVGKHPNLLFRSGLPESEFLDLYRRAALMVLPLRDATANNAILESMACGLPLVISDVGSVRDYVNPDHAQIVPSFNARRMADAIINLLENPEERKNMALHSRERAMQFSWNEVMKKLDMIYQTIN